MVRHGVGLIAFQQDARVEDADALPPNPKQTQTEAFLRPPEHPNEWGCHEAFAQAALQIAIPPSASPFVLPSVVDRLDDDAFQGFISSGRLSAKAAAHQAATQIDNEIDRTLRENAALVPRYQALLQRQRRRCRRMSA